MSSYRRNPMLSKSELRRITTHYLSVIVCPDETLYVFKFDDVGLDSSKEYGVAQLFKRKNYLYDFDTLQEANAKVAEEVQKAPALDKDGLKRVRKHHLSMTKSSEGKIYLIKFQNAGIASTYEYGTVSVYPSTNYVREFKTLMEAQINLSTQMLIDRDMANHKAAMAKRAKHS
ncbi:MAG: hypothetical protein H9W81_18500 [Enterococcus sp.]|nr:hypothetical protein [Enterococcus sp.]